MNAGVGDTYALYAIRSAQRRDHVIAGDPHEGPMPMDYFVWIAVGSKRIFVIDTRFAQSVAVRRKREYRRCPVLQESELHYASGRYMRYPRLSHSFEVDDICGIVRMNDARRASSSTTATPSSPRACAVPNAIGGGTVDR